MRKSGNETPIPTMESQYENTRVQIDPNNTVAVATGSMNHGSMTLMDNARILNYEFSNAPGRQSEESR